MWGKKKKKEGGSLYGRRGRKELYGERSREERLLELGPNSLALSRSRKKKKWEGKIAGLPLVLCAPRKLGESLRKKRWGERERGGSDFVPSIGRWERGRNRREGGFVSVAIAGARVCA